MPNNNNTESLEDLIDKANEKLIEIEKKNIKQNF